MNWLLKHWQPLAWLLSIFFAGIVLAESEYRDYRDMQEAVRSQKEFNDDVDRRMDRFDTMQQRIDERTQIMLDLLQKLDKK